MGTVYEAQDIRLGRKVAVKLMRKDTADETLAERLYREARAAARSEHPAVVTMYGYGVDPELDVNYVVMEYLQGETLAQRITTAGPLSIELVVRIALEVADALAAVHAAGVVHRDLKPSNIFLATRGRRVDDVKLLDFGVAKQLDLQTLTTTGQIYGTPTYMAPEQLSDSKRVDARCDLYSLGAVLFECATGRPPFTGRNLLAVASEVLLGQEPDVREHRTDLPEPLAAVITRCMRKQPADRFQDARSLSKALAAL
jgi:serine/threonine protein kinase